MSGYPPVTTFPGSAVGAAGATTDGVKELGPPGVRVVAFSVGEGGWPVGDGAGELADGAGELADGAGELADGDGAPVVLVGSGVSDGLSSPWLQPAVMAVMPAMAIPPSSNPIR